MMYWVVGITIYLLIGLLTVGVREIRTNFQYEMIKWAGWKDYVFVVTVFTIATVLWPWALYLNCRKEKTKDEVANG